MLRNNYLLSINWHHSFQSTCRLSRYWKLERTGSWFNTRKTLAKKAANTEVKHNQATIFRTVWKKHGKLVSWEHLILSSVTWNSEERNWYGLCFFQINLYYKNIGTKLHNHHCPSPSCNSFIQNTPEQSLDICSSHILLHIQFPCRYFTNTFLAKSLPSHCYLWTFWKSEAEHAILNSLIYTSLTREAKFSFIFWRNWSVWVRKKKQARTQHVRLFSFLNSTFLKLQLVSTQNKGLLPKIYNNWKSHRVISF